MNDLEGLAKVVEAVVYVREALAKIIDSIQSVNRVVNDYGFVWSELREIKEIVMKLGEDHERPKRAAEVALKALDDLRDQTANHTNKWWRQRARAHYISIWDILEGEKK